MLIAVHIGFAILFSMTGEFESGVFNAVIFGIAVLVHVASPIGLLTRRRIGVRLALVATAIEILYLLLVVYLTGAFAFGTVETIATDREPLVMVGTALVWAVFFVSPVVVSVAAVVLLVFIFRKLLSADIAAWAAE